MSDIKQFARGSWVVFAFALIWVALLASLSACHDAPLGVGISGDSTAVDSPKVEAEKPASGVKYDPKIDSIRKDTLRGGTKF